MPEDVEGDFVIPNPENNEENTEGENPENKPSFDIPTGKSKTRPESQDDIFDDETPKNSGRKKSVYLEKVVNKAIIDILEDLKEIHSISYQKDVKRTAEKIGNTVMYLNESLKGNI